MDVFQAPNIIYLLQATLPHHLTSLASHQQTKNNHDLYIDVGDFLDFSLKLPCVDSPQPNLETLLGKVGKNKEFLCDFINKDFHFIVDANV